MKKNGNPFIIKLQIETLDMLEMPLKVVSHQKGDDFFNCEAIHSRVTFGQDLPDQFRKVGSWFQTTKEITKKKKERCCDTRKVEKIVSQQLHRRSGKQKTWKSMKQRTWKLLVNSYSSQSRKSISGRMFHMKWLNLMEIVRKSVKVLTDKKINMSKMRRKMVMKKESRFGSLKKKSSSDFLSVPTIIRKDVPTSKGSEIVIKIELTTSVETGRDHAHIRNFGFLVVHGVSDVTQYFVLVALSQCVENIEVQVAKFSWIRVDVKYELYHHSIIEAPMQILSNECVVIDAKNF
ncbi:hypothetical protein RFI_37525 [Reticulomyxa filosa]|uniref:Uncharacterized protein n=1 Tax=Reticulomyxa filosa TaxID=46433 RepID=X6LEH4_RETFI|nr:hypothetical protein RFI_37525 [Reticulomyxa filosa]|eukprot:ETN99943.1 hypothetical protein RFI_37525 [Reticulomyxa filosa]